VQRLERYRLVKDLRLALSIVVVVAAGLLLMYRYCWLPLQCSSKQLDIERLTLQAFDQKDSPRSKTMARRNLVALERCLEVCPTDTNVLMLIAANDQLLGLYSDARDMYAAALRVDRRPEIYLQLGLVELRLHELAAAREHVRTAVAFNPAYLDSIEDGLLRQDAEALLQKEHVARGNLVDNGDFSKAKPIGATREFLGSGKGTESAAEGWFIFNNGPGHTTTTMTRVTRSGSMRGVLAITTDCAYCGILQSWGLSKHGPDRVETATWVFVRKGRVMISSGDLGMGQMDAVSSQTGQWELLRAPNRSCPANHTRISSYDGPAEFYLDGVSVVAVAGRPCESTP